MIGTSFNDLDVLYHHAEFGEIELRAPDVGAKMWCLYVFCLSRSESGGPFARVRYNLNSYCVTVYGSTLIPFYLFFRSDCLYRGARQFLFPSLLVGATIFAKLRSKMRKVQKSAKKFVCPTLYG